MAIRTLQEKDIEAVQRLLDSAKPYVLPHHHYVYWMLQRLYPECNLVFEKNNELVGYIGALPSLYNDSMFIWQLVVDQNHKREGIAGRLVNDLVETAKRLGLATFELSIDVDNKNSFAFFSQVARDMNSELAKTGQYCYRGNCDNIYQITIK